MTIPAQVAPRSLDDSDILLKADFFNDLVKTAPQLWFPVPSDEEMYAAAPLYGVDMALCGQLMHRWGNVPHYVLQHARNAEQAITSVSAKSIEDAVRDWGGADRLTAKLVHVRATPDLAYNGVGLGSVWIQLQLYERLRGYEGGAAQRLVEFCTGLGAGLAAGAGGVHQGVTHRAPKRGGWFLLRNHQGQQSVIWLPPLRVVEVSNSQQVAELASWWEASPTYLRPAGMYALPSNPTFAAVGSAMILDPASLAPPTAKASTPTSSTSDSSFSSALSNTTYTSAQWSATEPLEAAHTGVYADACTASAATLAAEAGQATAVMDEPAASGAASSPPPAAAAATGSGGKALVLGVQITTNRSHKINYPGWQNFSSATGSHTLAFAVPLRSWATCPPQKFDGGPADAAQQAPCDQQVITWVPVTAGELSNLTVEGLRKLSKAYGIDDASTLSRDLLVRRLVEAEVPTADLGIVEAALQKVCSPPPPQAEATATEPATEPEPAANAADSVARALYAAGLPVARGKVQQTVSPAQRFSKAQVRGWSAKWLRHISKSYAVPTKGEDGKALCVEDLQERFISELGINR